jgi:lipoprotein-releasing system permease protein
LTDALAQPRPSGPKPPGPFSRFEFLVAGRYLRARRKERFVSVIALLTLVGVALGVATLITVMSVMNGFRSELLGKILGLNGHFVVQNLKGPFTDYNDVVRRLEGVPGVTYAIPYVEGQALPRAAPTPPAWWCGASPSARASPTGWASASPTR